MLANKNLKEYAKRIRDIGKRLKKKSGDRNVTVALLGEKKEEETIVEYAACHAAVTYNYPAADNVSRSNVRFKQRVILSRIQNLGVSKDTALRYWNWLINYSPFAPVFITRSAEKAFKRGYFVVRTDLRADLMMGGLIASRLPTEHFTPVYKIENTTILWENLVDRGVHPSLAFTLAHRFVLSDHGVVILRISEPGHMAISTCVSNYNDWSSTHINFYKNKMQGDVLPFETTNSHNGSSKLWCNNQKSNVNSIIVRIFDMCKRGEEVKEVKNPFLVKTEEVVQLKKWADTFSKNAHLLIEEIERVAA